MNSTFPEKDRLNDTSKGGVKPGYKLSKQERLRHSRQFKEIYTRGHRLSGPHLTIFVKPNQLNFNRLGLTVTKRRFKLSKQRHYIQRCLREAYRLNKIRFLSGYDIIFSAQSLNKGKARFEDIKNELLSLAQKAGLLEQ